MGILVLIIQPFEVSWNNTNQSYDDEVFVIMQGYTEAGSTPVVQLIRQMVQLHLVETMV